MKSAARWRVDGQGGVVEVGDRVDDGEAKSVPVLMGATGVEAVEGLDDLRHGLAWHLGAVAEGQQFRCRRQAP
jgi:hypothetical protein